MDRQAELIRQAQDGDKKARDTFVAENLGLVHAIVRRFEKRGHDRDELLLIDQLGSRGEGSGQQEDTVLNRLLVEQGCRTGREDNEVQTR